MNFFDSQSFLPAKDHRATFSKSLQKNQSGPDFRSVFFRWMQMLLLCRDFVAIFLSA